MGSVDLLLLLLTFLQSVHGLPVPDHVESGINVSKPLNIIDINRGLKLFEGDILFHKNMGRNSIIGDQYRWPLSVPYYLEDSLEMNAKGIIMQAFERFRLKTCIDFKPWQGEANFISVFRGGGCYSYVGNLNAGKQVLSIGSGCDTVEIVQHEFLHALGFWHEQSRSDRDDYVTIIWENISPGYENNFNKFDDSVSSFLNVPYDYTSVMHYSAGAFQNGLGPTIISKMPQFQNLIGGQMGLSESDVQKLNQLYNCASPVSFMDSCTFEDDNVCGMIQNSDDNSDWLHVSEVTAGPSSDRTYVGKATGYFMHYNTSTGNAGDKAMLESRLFYPKRGIQCLEFFYYNSGSESDELNIWIREYTGDSPNGTLRFINTVTGKPADYWQLHYAPINATNKFRFIFQGVKRNEFSSGGISVDDINLSETECPHYVWQIRNFTHELIKQTSITSPPYYSKDGYAFQISLWQYIDMSFGFHFQLLSGANDYALQWPCPWRQATVEIMDQNPNIQQRISNAKSITTDPTRYYTDTTFYWDNPAIVGENATFPNGTHYYLGPGEYSLIFYNQEWFYRRDFAKGGDVFVLISMEDISNLTSQNIPTTRPFMPTTTSPLPVPKTTHPASEPTSGTFKTSMFCINNICENDGDCVIENMKPVCRCKYFSDYWYEGERCEIKVVSDANIPATSFVALAVAMLTVIHVAGV